MLKQKTFNTFDTYTYIEQKKEKEQEKEKEKVKSYTLILKSHEEKEILDDTDKLIFEMINENNEIVDYITIKTTKDYGKVKTLKLTMKDLCKSEKIKKIIDKIKELYNEYKKYEGNEQASIYFNSKIYYESLLLDHEIEKIVRKFENITKLDLSNCGLFFVPIFIFSLNKLKTLHLKNNNIGYVDEGIQKMSNLDELDLSNNRLRIISKGIYYMSKLKRFICRNNMTMYIDNAIGNMTSLQVFDNGDDEPKEKKKNKK